SAAAHKGVLLRDKERPDRWGFRTDRYKLIQDLEREVTEVYDLQHDAAESRSLAAHSELARPLGARLFTELAQIRPRDWAEPGNHVLSEEQKSRLRALGYLH